MYSLQEYNNYEKSFLSHIAEKLGFTERRKLVFEQRFLSSNDDLKNNRLAEVLEEDLRKDNPDTDINTIFRDELNKIYKKLEEQGCNFNGQTHNKFPIAKDWLQKICWPKYQQDFLWYLMKNKGSLTDNMKLILVPEKSTTKPASLDMWETEESEHNYVTSVSLGSQIHFEINLDSPGHLLLLQKGTSGKFWCICPSFLVADTHLPAGKTILPQEELKNKHFKISGETGQDEMLAVISPELPNFNWLPKVKNGSPLEMKPNHFSELAAYLETTKPTVFYMEYTITA